MNKIKKITKGYTIEVVSWECVFDNYETNSIVVNTPEEAKQWFNVLQHCKSRNSSKTQVLLGNSFELNNKQKKLIKKLILDYPLVFGDIAKAVKNDDEDVIYDATYKISELLGTSEDYLVRVLQKCTITYSPDDIYCEEFICFTN